MDEDIDFLEEISDHIKDIKNGNLESTNNQESKTEFLEWKEVTEGDLFEVVNKVEETNEEITTQMNYNLATRICDQCKEVINLENNLSGLVVHDSYFLCEKCCNNLSKEELDKWTKSRMAKPGDLKPVALWLMREKNKNKLL